MLLEESYLRTFSDSLGVGSFTVSSSCKIFETQIDSFRTKGGLFPPLR